MDEVRIRVRPLLLLCIAFATSLLQLGAGETDLPNIIVAFDMADPNQVTLECLGESDGLGQPATLTFVNPLDVKDKFSMHTDNRDRLTFSILPQNETIVSCRLDGGSMDSESVAITAIPLYTNATAIRQYVFSDSDTIELYCPLELGRLHGMITPYDFLWNLRLGEPGSGDSSVTDTAVNGTHGTFYYRDNNRLLHVQLPSPLPETQYSLQCEGQIQRCNSPNIANQRVCRVENTDDSPFITLDFVDPVTIVNHPSNATVIQNEDASFDCTVTNGVGDISIKWEVDGMVYDRENCNELCTVSESESGNKTSVLTIHTGRIHRVTEETSMNIVCVVNQAVFEQQEGLPETTEVRPAYKSQKSEAAQLITSPAPTTTPPPTTPTTRSTSGTPSPGRGSALEVKDIYTITGVICGFILTIIVILSFCIVCIFRYHYKNKESRLGRRLRRTFSKDANTILQKFTKRAPSPMQLESQHFQGTESAPTNHVDANTAHAVNGKHLLGPDQIYNYSQNSGVSGASSYSGMSGVSQNNGPHQMPQFRESYQEATAVPCLSLPPTTVAGNGALLIADPHPNGSRRPSDASGSFHSGHSLTHHQQQQPMYYPGTMHGGGSLNMFPFQQQYPQQSGGPETTSLPRMAYIQYSTPSHVSLDPHNMPQPLDVQPSLPNLTHPVQYITYPQLAASQPLMSDRTYSMNSNHSHRSSSHHSSTSQNIAHQSPHVQPINPYHAIPAPQPHFISRNDLATVELALMHNKHCQIQGCCCYKVREIMENRGYRPAPYDSPEMGSICSSGSGNSSRLQRVAHQQSSTDSDSDYFSERDKKGRPLNLRLLSDEHNRNPNLHPHYHLTTKSYLRRLSSQANIDHRRSKSLSDLTPLTELPETSTPAKTPAIGGIIKPGTPVYQCQPQLGEEISEQGNTDDCMHPAGRPALLREISISADNIPALCLNDCPFTPSPLKEGRHQLAQSPNRGRRRGSFRKGSMRSAKPNLKTVKEKRSSDTDDSNTSSRADSPIKSSLSDDDGIVVDIQGRTTPKEKSSAPQKKTASAGPTHVQQQELSVATEPSLHDSSSDTEVREILQNANKKDSQKTPSTCSHSPFPNRKYDGANLNYLSSNGIAMTDPRMRRSTSPLSVASSSHSRRSASPYETEVHQQNGIITEITEC